MKYIKIFAEPSKAAEHTKVRVYRAHFDPTRGQFSARDEPLIFEDTLGLTQQWLMLCGYVHIHGSQGVFVAP